MSDTIETAAAGRYRKRPVVIEAMQLTDTNAAAVKRWIESFYDGRVIMRGGPGGGSRSATLIIKTLEGDHEASVGDQVIRGVQDEAYPCKPDIFDATYSPAEDGPTVSPDAVRLAAAARSMASASLLTDADCRELLLKAQAALDVMRDWDTDAARLRAGIEALADEWAADAAREYASQHDMNLGHPDLRASQERERVTDRHAAALRALLSTDDEKAAQA